MLKLYNFNTKTLVSKHDFNGTLNKEFEVVTGSRLVIALTITEIDVGASVALTLDNGFSVDISYENVLSISSGNTGFFRKVISDIHNLFKFNLVVSGGNASFAVGISIADNAMTTRIDNTEISVDLNHVVQSNGEYDSVRIGNGINEMDVDTDKNAHTEVHGNKPNGNDVVQILTEEGRTTNRGDYHDTVNTKPSSFGLIGHERNVAKTENHQTKRVSAIDSSVNLDVTALDTAIRDELGNPYTKDNPMPTSDIADSGGLTSELTILPGATAELKVGASPKIARKYVMFQSQNKGVTWGHSTLTTFIQAFKNQFFILPFGVNTSIFFKNNSTVSVKVSIGEES